MAKSLFFCGIGGSGMLPLASLTKALGAHVYGSDRSRDQGRTPEKFTWLEDQGIFLSPQDGSGITSHIDEVIVSTAVEESIPDVAAAKAKNITITHRAALLARYFNRAHKRIAIAGTSGKSTVTGMIAFAMSEMQMRPTVMNGGVMLDFASYTNPYVSAIKGHSEFFVAETDESDGTISLYEPDIAVVTNIALDHKNIDELRVLFDRFCSKATQVIINADNAECLPLIENFRDKVITYSVEDHPDLRLKIPGGHNRSNAAAALAVIRALDLDVAMAKDILRGFSGIKRRLETIGIAHGVTVIDDFAHNPDKVLGSLAALKETSGRLIILYQPHGYGMLKLTGKAMGEAFASLLSSDDRLLLTQPLYLGGSVDRTVGVDVIAQEFAGARIYQTKEKAMPDLVDQAQPGDRIVIMGARDDTLSLYAQDVLEAVSRKFGSKKQASP